MVEKTIVKREFLVHTFTHSQMKIKSCRDRSISSTLNRVLYIYLCWLVAKERKRFKEIRWEIKEIDRRSSIKGHIDGGAVS